MFIPLSLNMHPRFMVTVEFIDWKIAPEPHMVVSFSALIVSIDRTTGSAEESFP